MSKKKTDDDFDFIKDDLLPYSDGKEDLSETDKSEMIPAPKIEHKRRKTASNSKYSSFRMRTEILKDMEAIAEKERIPFTGQLVHAVLKNYIDWYKNK